MVQRLVLSRRGWRGAVTAAAATSSGRSISFSFGSPSVPLGPSWCRGRMTPPCHCLRVETIEPMESAVERLEELREARSKLLEASLTQLSG
jgi:hypothetical protein